MKPPTIYLTGASGLLGRAVRDMLQRRGWSVIGCDLRANCLSERYDLRDADRVRAHVAGCDGVIHLGAVSRVVWGEQYPVLCHSINIEGARTVMRAVAESPRKPYLLFASSREIYGTPPALPCIAGTAPNPENTYARSKLAGETMALDLRRCGNLVAVVRFSNVFGSTADYHDRVVPAFAKAAAHKGTLYVRGPDSVFDFTTRQDVVAAVSKTLDALAAGIGDLPPIDLVSGRATSLRELAQMALNQGDGEIILSPPHAFYPKYFQGDPRPAKQYLGWSAKQPLEAAVARLVEDFRHGGKVNAHTKSNSWISALL